MTCADNAELMDCRHAADDNEIIQRDMAGERGIAGQNTAVSDRTIVRNER